MNGHVDGWCMVVDDGNGQVEDQHFAERCRDADAYVHVNIAVDVIHNEKVANFVIKPSDQMKQPE